MNCMSCKKLIYPWHRSKPALAGFGQHEHIDCYIQRLEGLVLHGSSMKALEKLWEGQSPRELPPIVFEERTITARRIAKSMVKIKGEGQG